MRQTGQMILESILVMIVFAIVGLLTVQAFQSGQYLKQIVQGPWSYVCGMIESGVWENCTRQDIYLIHPNYINRHQTPDPRQ